MQFEHEAGVIVEAAAEIGGEFDGAHVDAAGGQKAGARFEQIERRAERDFGVGRERAQFARRIVRIAGDRQEALDQRAGLARQPRRRIERRLFEETVGDFGDRAAADRGDAGDREQIGDQMMRRLRIGAGERGEHALIFLRAVGGSERHLIEIVLERGFAVEILDQAALPHRRQIERGDESRKQPDVADADLGRADAVLRGRFEPERQHFGVGRRLVGAAEAFDAGLEEFGRRAVAMAEHRAEIAEAGGLSGLRRSQIIARHRNGQIGPQAQFAAVRIGGQKHAPADVLAGQVEERLGRLQHRRLDARIAGARIGRDQRLRPRVRIGRCVARHMLLPAAGCSPAINDPAIASDVGGPFSTTTVAIR